MRNKHYIICRALDPTTNVCVACGVKDMTHKQMLGDCTNPAGLDDREVYELTVRLIKQGVRP